MLTALLAMCNIFGADDPKKKIQCCDRNSFLLPLFIYEQTNMEVNMNVKTNAGKEWLCRMNEAMPMQRKHRAGQTPDWVEETLHPPPLCIEVT